MEKQLNQAEAVIKETRGKSDTRILAIINSDKLQDGKEQRLVDGHDQRRVELHFRMLISQYYPYMAEVEDLLRQYRGRITNNDIANVCDDKTRFLEILDISVNWYKKLFSLLLHEMERVDIGKLKRTEQMVFGPKDNDPIRSARGCDNGFVRVEVNSEQLSQPVVEMRQEECIGRKDEEQCKEDQVYSLLKDTLVLQYGGLKKLKNISRFQYSEKVQGDSKVVNAVDACFVK